MGKNNVVVCPVCRVHCHANNLIENQFLLEVSGSSSEANATDPSSDLKCTSCHENSPATSWCVECSEYICDGCVQKHVTLTRTCFYHFFPLPPDYMIHSKGRVRKGGKKTEKPADAGYFSTHNSLSLFPPPPITSTHPSTPLSSLPSDPRQRLSVSVPWSQMNWDSANILLQETSDEDNSPPKCRHT
uniref:B box-type domain-containing protein n=1 Tax=Timema shepardi TaxID=629360 RepID=A0A7R9B6L8_TIMSH|nr:unnamed protein product [Timema shepardi]